MRMLRHSKIAVTMEIYTQVLDQAAREALCRLEDSSTASDCCTLLLHQDQKRLADDRKCPLTWLAGWRARRDSNPQPSDP
jgi:hypothetical protein